MNGENDKCPYCGGERRLKSGRFGKFWECQNLPKCYFTCNSDIGYDFLLSNTWSIRSKIGRSAPDVVQGERN